MALVIRAEHTMSWFEPNPDLARLGRNHIVHPARAGDAHLVDERGRTLCGRDGASWKSVTMSGWADAGDYRCPACESALARRLARQGRRGRI